MLTRILVSAAPDLRTTHISANVVVSDHVSECLSWMFGECLPGRFWLCSMEQVAQDIQRVQALTWSLSTYQPPCVWRTFTLYS